MTAPTRTSRPGLPKWMAVSIGVVLAFLIGSGMQYFRANRLSGDLEQTRHALAFARMEATLGAAALDAQRQSYETSRQLASVFYTDLQQHIEEAPEEARDGLRALLGERDHVITLLSRSDPESANVLSRAFVTYRSLVSQALPQPAAPADGTQP